LILTKAVLRIQFGEIGVSNALQYHIQIKVIHMSDKDEEKLYTSENFKAKPMIIGAYAGRLLPCVLMK
jgi:hypothetical protein